MTPDMQAAFPDARLRITRAGVRCIVQKGVAGASMSAIAAEGSVSKALLHYHFSDRAQLLGEIAALLGHQLVMRERAVLGRRQEGPTVVDVLWQWLDGELQRGELRALLELGTVRNEIVRAAVNAVNQDRRTTTAATVAQSFTRLGLTPRVPAELIADANIAFVNGLALSNLGSAEARVSFDVFWLAILSLSD